MMHFIFLFLFIKLRTENHQTLGGLDKQRFVGCAFPARSAYRMKIQNYGLSIGKYLASKGAIGHFSVDFLVRSVPIDEDDRWMTETQPMDAHDEFVDDDDAPLPPSPSARAGMHKPEASKKSTGESGSQLSTAEVVLVEEGDGSKRWDIHALEINLRPGRVL